MISTQQWSRTYTSTKGDPTHDSFRYKRDPKDKIEADLAKNCLIIGGTPTWVLEDTTYTLSISNDFEASKNFGRRPKEEEPYKKTIVIESMPPTRNLPEGLLTLLERNSFEKE